VSLHGLMAVLFWASVAATLYAYFGFPLLVRLLTSRKSSAEEPNGGAESRLVPVTVIVPAYNEERHLAAKLENVLASDYPGQLLDVLVVSDASTDRTNAIAAGFASRGVRLIVQERRQGKTAGLNRAMALAKGEAVVFTDANASYPPDTIRRLVRYLDDPRVGLVTGYTRYTTSDGDVSEVTNLYTRLERQIKAAESQWGCCVGADGAIFAMRRSLYHTLRDDDINDFVLPLGVIERGYHCVFAEDAFCSESPGEDLESEFRRQSRITNRTLRALWRNRTLMNPVRFPLFAFLLFSHKVMRLSVPLFLVVAACALAVLASTHVVYGAIAAVAAGFIGLALVLNLLPHDSTPGLMGFLLAFLTINVAMLNGWAKFMFGNSDTTWQHHRVGGH